MNMNKNTPSVGFINATKCSLCPLNNITNKTTNVTNNVNQQVNKNTQNKIIICPSLPPR